MAKFDFNRWKDNCTEIHVKFESLYEFFNKYTTIMKTAENNTNMVMDKLKNKNYNDDLISDYRYYVFLYNWRNCFLNQRVHYIQYRFLDIYDGGIVEQLSKDINILKFSIKENEKVYFLTNDNNRIKLKNNNFTGAWLFLFDDTDGTDMKDKHGCKTCEAKKMIYTIKKLSNDIESFLDKLNFFYLGCYSLFDKKLITPVDIDLFSSDKEYYEKSKKIFGKLRNIYNKIPKVDDVNMIMTFLKPHIELSKQYKDQK